MKGILEFDTLLVLCTLGFTHCSTQRCELLEMETTVQDGTSESQTMVDRKWGRDCS